MINFATYLSKNHSSTYMIYNLALLLPCTVCLIGAAWLVCRRESNTLPQKILAVGFLFAALFFLCTANYVVGSLDSSTFMWWDITDCFVAMLTIPTMYLYFRSMIDEGRFTWKEYIWFVPALIVGVGTAALYLVMDKAEMEGYIQSVLIEGNEDSHYSGTIYRLHQFVGVEVYNVAALAQLVGISVFAFLGFRKYHQRLNEFYSDADDKSIHTDNKILLWCLFTIPLSLVLIITEIDFWEKHHLPSSLFFITWGVAFFAWVYYGSQKRHTVDNFAQDLQQADLDEKSYCETETVEEESEESDMDNHETPDKQISIEVLQRLAIQLTKLVDEERVYLKSDLRLDEVARLIFTNRVYVSKVIKEEYHCSFSDYINRKRIDFSMELMRSDPTLTQDIIAEKSGFINAQSYSRTFKKMIGIPPKEWLNRNIYRS